MYQQPTQQIFCPVCHGGNPVGAVQCMWCHTAFQQPQIVYVKQNSNGRLRAFVAVVGVVVALAIIAALATPSLGPGRPSSSSAPHDNAVQPTSNPQVAETAVLVAPATANRAPVAAATVATAVANVTATVRQAQVEPTGTSTVSGAELAYMSSISGWSSSYASALYDFSTLMGNPQFADPNWKLQVANDMAAITLTDHQVLSYKAPASLSGLDAQMKQVAQHLENMNTDVAAGIDNLDAASISAGTDEMTKANDILQSIVAKMNGK